MARAGIRCYVNGEKIRVYGDSRGYIKALFEKTIKSRESILSFAGNPKGSSKIKLIRYNKTKAGKKVIKDTFEINIINEPIILSGGIVHSERVNSVAKELLKVYGIDCNKESGE